MRDKNSEDVIILEGRRCRYFHRITDTQWSFDATALVTSATNAQKRPTDVLTYLYSDSAVFCGLVVFVVI